MGSATAPPAQTKIEINGSPSERDFEGCHDTKVDMDGQLSAHLQYPVENGLSKSKKGSSSSVAPLDPWAVVGGETENFGVPWDELNSKEKLIRILIGISKAVGLLVLLYFFVCSLDLLSLGFRIAGGRTTGAIFRNSEILENPVVGVMVGILTTVLVQSSSTSTSIIVSMVSADFLTVKIAIPIIMGANIGTSITNTIVSFTQAGDRNQFRRAFAGATVHDMFNWLTVITLLILEVTTHYLLEVSTAIMDAVFSSNATGGGEIEILGVITKPFVNMIVQIDKNVLNCWSQTNCTKHDNSSLIKEFCENKKKSKMLPEPLLIDSYDTMTEDGVIFQDLTTTEIPTTALISTTLAPAHQCKFLFHGTSLSDEWAGVIILICSLAVLCLCLILIVKVLNSVLQGQIALVIKKTLNAKIPYVPWITGYIAILVGALMTFLVQSSSVFTSALTPLVGLGVLTVERVYPLTLGSNIGTTTTAFLASMAVDGDSLKPSMQIALCHLLFNVTGIIIFYPIPFLRLPIKMAKFLGDTTAKYRWFAIVYMVVMFIVVPALFMGLSFAGPVYVIIAASIICFVFLFVCLVNLIRSKKPSLLPEFLQSWKWLPVGFRSLEPYDKLFSRLKCCSRLKQKSQDHSDGGGAFHGNNQLGTELTSSDDKFQFHVTSGTNKNQGNINPAFDE